MGEPCPWCQRANTHYMTHVCEGCECSVVEVRIPGEPHIPPYLEAEWNPECPVHREDVSKP